MYKQDYFICTAEILYPLLKESKVIIMILEKKSSGYRLIDIRGFDYGNFCAKFINDFLEENELARLFADEKFSDYFRGRNFIQIPNSNCVLFMGWPTVRSASCSCGKSAIENYSFEIVIPDSDVAQEFCTHCLLEKFKISVPALFRKGYDYHQHMKYNCYDITKRFIEKSIWEG